MSSTPPPADSRPSPSFVALRHAGFRPFLAGGVLAMMADNIEHVITYWVIFQEFKSPALGGFAVIAHWLPFLLFSVPVGALAERVDPRRLIQSGMVLFILVSLVWGVLILTDSLQLWHAALLLAAHGIAGVLWSPPAQLLLHDIVGRDRLQSAVRLNATGRYLGMFLGPAVGSAMLLTLGPAYALFFNMLIYLPLTLWLWKAPYGPRFRKELQAAPAAAVRSIRDVTAVVRDLGHYPVIATMTMLAGGAAFFVGNAYQAQMPGFATDLGHGDPGISYSMLLAADAAGALAAGIALETFGLLRPDPRTALILALLWGIALGSFAARAFLSARAGPAIGRWIPRALVQLDVADAGAAACAGRKARPHHRRVLDGFAGLAHVQRILGRHPRADGRYSLVAGRERGVDRGAHRSSAEPTYASP